MQQVSMEAWRELACAVANRDLTPGEWRALISNTQSHQTICFDGS
jgi:hypothetical protein